jgi:hypothetical protein
MSDGIFIIQPDGELVELSEKKYDSESVLQNLLTKYPNLLAGRQIDGENPRRWLLISREMGIPLEEGGGNWLAVDHLFLDQEGIPTFVEVKRSSDTRIRREVIGQMLDYAANAVKYWPPETIREQFEAKLEARGQDSGQKIMDFLGEGMEPDEFWPLVQNNLQIGKIRMLFVADSVPPELQRIVEFLNEQMNPAEVLAIEIKQFAGQDIQTLVPRVIGQTSETQRTKRRSTKRKWDEESFFRVTEEQNGRERAKIAREIFEWVNSKKIEIWWGEGKELGSFVPRITHKEITHQLFAIYTTGWVEIYFQWYQYKKPFDDEEKRKAILRKLNAIEGVNIAEDRINKRPSIDLLVFNRADKLSDFFEIYEWILEEVKAT